MLVSDGLLLGGGLMLPPLAELAYSPGTGVDYWLWSLQLSGLGTTLGAINFLITILKLRAPGMSIDRMPLFLWSSLTTSVAMLFAMPSLTVKTTV